jgi:hypothetical protein
VKGVGKWIMKERILLTRPSGRAFCEGRGRALGYWLRPAIRRNRVLLGGRFRLSS